MQDPKDKKAIMADAYSDKRVKELEMATKTPYQMKMASMGKKPENVAELKEKKRIVLDEKIIKGAKAGAMEMAKLSSSMKLLSMKKKGSDSVPKKITTGKSISGLNSKIYNPENK
jgi:hypothetical protein